MSVLHGGPRMLLHVNLGEATYRRCRPVGGHHHHVVCRGCGITEQIEAPAVERWAGTVARRTGFVDVTHIVELVGLCTTCATANRERRQDAPGLRSRA